MYHINVSSWNHSVGLAAALSLSLIPLKSLSQNGECVCSSSIAWHFLNLHTLYYPSATLITVWLD